MGKVTFRLKMQSYLIAQQRLQTFLSSLVDKDGEGHHYFAVSAGKYWMGTGGKSGVARIKKGTPRGAKLCRNGIALGTVQYESRMTSVCGR